MYLIKNLHNNLLFYPSKDFCSTPGSEGIVHEEIFIDTEDMEKLHGYFFPAKDKTDKAIIYLHGNGDNVSGWYIAPFQIQQYVNVNALLIDYRGYGKSTGKPSIDGVIKDAEAMYAYLIRRGYKSKDISLYGRSLGGAIALELANKATVRSIVIQSSFTSLKDAAKDIYPFIPSILIEGKTFNSKELIKKITIPVLISHGEDDEVIPVKHSYVLYELANEPKKLIVFPNADHNNVGKHFNEEYFNALSQLFT